MCAPMPAQMKGMRTRTVPQVSSQLAAFLCRPAESSSLVQSESRQVSNLPLAGVVVEVSSGVNRSRVRQRI